MSKDLWSSRLSLYPAGLLLFWAALNTCTNPDESREKEGIEKRERERERERRGR